MSMDNALCGGMYTLPHRYYSFTIPRRGVPRSNHPQVILREEGSGPGGALSRGYTGGFDIGADAWTMDFLGAADIRAFL